ncbi:MAG: serine hydrolase domain-containing protein [Chitinophagaceae bacterium]
MKQFFLSLLLFTAVSASAQTWQDTVALLDKILNRYTSENPGAQVAVSRNGQLIYSAARGVANLEDGAVLTKESRIEAGSVSKQFTAASILLLEQQGKLSLNDDIRKYLPEVPDYGHTITIRHLMSHTSGLKDWGSIADIAGWPRGTKAYNNDDALHIVTLQKTLNNIPGAEYIYSNSNYNLMAIIVRRVSGMSLAGFSRQYIFIPAGMTHTEWRDDYTRVVPQRAIAYSKNGPRYVTNMPNEDVYGNGGLLTTAEDLLAWNNYYLNGKFGSPSLLSRQTTTVPLNNGKRHFYAAGLFIDSLNGWPAITHSGATAGYRANLDYFPQLGLSIAWLSNTSQQDMGNTPGLVRNLLVKNKAKAPPMAIANKNIDSKTFLPYMGVYKDNVTGAALSLALRNDSVYNTTSGASLPAINATTLLAGRARIIFTSQQPRKATFINAAGDTLLYTGVEPPPTDVQALQEYTGIYYSSETEGSSSLVIKEGKVYMYMRVGRGDMLTPMYKDGFSFPGGEIVFERDSQGKISGFYVSVSRARNVQFIKAK